MISEKQKLALGSRKQSLKSLDSFDDGAFISPRSSKPSNLVATGDDQSESSSISDSIIVPRQTMDCRDNVDEYNGDNE